MKAGSFRWYGEGPARELEHQLASFEGGSAEESRLHRELGFQLLKLGRPADAVRAFGRALQLLPQPNPDTDTDAKWSLVWYLGLSYLQLAEDLNCVAHHGRDSCILPLAEGGVHSRPEAAQRAGDLFLGLLASNPERVQAAWLANLSYLLAGRSLEAVPEAVRLPAEALAPEVRMPRWTDRAPELGLDAPDMAGGAVMDDFDGDGFLDLVSTTWDPCDHAKAFRGDGRGGFEEVTRAWGLDEQLGGLNLVHADYDGDGRLDLLILRGGWMFEEGRVRNSLLRNELTDGRGRFVDVTRSAGLAEPAYPTQSAVWADYDGDGDLDLFVANETTSKLDFYPSQLFRNDGDGTFTDVAREAGVTNDRYAKGAAWGDYDDDGDPDLFVSNIGENRLYRNDGRGRFTDVAEQAGVAGDFRRTFVPWFFDYDNDGDLDLLVADYAVKLQAVTASYYGVDAGEGQPFLYRNDRGRFTEVSRKAGLTRPALPMGSNYGDLDNDGWLDLYLGTGVPAFAAVMPNLVFHNEEGRFREVTFASGLGHLQKGHAVAFGDVDNDGDQDIFEELGGFYPVEAFGNALFENPGPARSWITLRLRGVRANRFGIGARIEARVREGDQRRSIHLLAGSGGSFGGSSLQQEIGLGDAEALEQLVVRWPGSGTVDRVRKVPLDHAYLLVEGSGKLLPVEMKKVTLGSHASPKAPRPTVPSRG
jgi:hypothetical protein